MRPRSSSTRALQAAGSAVSLRQNAPIRNGNYAKARLGLISVGSGVNSPRSRWSCAAKPIMAALSVQRVGAAKRNSSPARSAPNDICRRSSPLQLTPPLTVISFRPAICAAVDCFRDQHVNHGALERSAQIPVIPSAVEGSRRALQLRQQVADCGFQPAKTEIRVTRVDHAARQIEPRRIAASRAALDLRSTRIGQPEHLGHFVECLAGRVIDRPSDDPVITNFIHLHQQSVSAAYDERHVGLDAALAPKKGREQMTLKMIDREIRFPEAEREPLGQRRSDHERTGQPRPARGSEGIDFA